MKKQFRKLKHKYKELLTSLSWENKREVYKSILWYLFLIYIGMVIFFLQRIYLLENSEYEKILSILISTIGITVAIIISFLFSKLFSEKNERIIRKQKIDHLSKKLTSLRKIVHFLRRSHEFWNHFNPNIKSFLDYKYKRLTLNQYDRLEYDNHRKFHEEVQFGELAAQAYLGLKDIEGKVYSTIVFLDSLMRKNYSLDELEKCQDSCRRMWSFMDEYHEQFREVSTLSVLETKPIKENLKIIYPDFTTEDFNNKKIKQLFDDFPEIFIREQYSLTQRNEVSFGKSFNALLFDLIVFVFLIIIGVLLLSIEITSDIKLLITNGIVALFSATVIDLIANVIISIRNELNITEFYEA